MECFHLNIALVNKHLFYVVGDTECSFFLQVEDKQITTSEFYMVQDKKWLNLGDQQYMDIKR